MDIMTIEPAILFEKSQQCVKGMGMETGLIEMCNEIFRRGEDIFEHGM